MMMSGLDSVRAVAQVALTKAILTKVIDCQHTAMDGNRMITIRQKTPGLHATSRIILLCVVHASYAVAAEPRPAQIPSADERNTRFSHLTTNAALRGGSEAVADSRHRHFKNIRARGPRRRENANCPRPA
jgi:hypothetical protein